jgi:hypothetical protein
VISNDVAVPGNRARLAFALAIGLVAGLLCYGNQLTPWGRPGDFGQSWFGARSLVSGINPYPEVGPGRMYDSPWPLLYPATSFLVAMPLAWLPRLWATIAFSSISSALLAYSVTETGWHRWPMFGSAPFIFAAGSSQWSPLFTAALTIPVLAIAFIAKPTIGVALAAVAAGRVQKFAAYGGIVLLIASILWLPSWPADWLDTVRTATHISSPLSRAGGMFVFLALLSWKRPEARLILALALVPQSGAWYEALPLFLVAATRAETMLLATLSCLGFLFYYPRMDLVSEVQVNEEVGSLIVALVYLPAVIMVLRRPNQGDVPVWLQTVSRLSRPRR